MKKKWLLSSVLLFTALSVLFAQDAPKLTLETMNDPSLMAAFNVPRTWWLDDGSALLLDTRKPFQEMGMEHLNPKTGERTPWFDMQAAIASFNALFEGRTVPRIFPVPRSMDGSGRYGTFLVQGDLFLLDMKQSLFMRLTETPEEEKAVRLSPDGRKVAFVRENDLYVIDIAKKKETRLTVDGSETLLNGTLSWVYWEEMFGRQDQGYWWSGDSRSIAYLQTDESAVSVQHIVDFSPWTPTVQKQRYPKVGETNPTVRVGIVGLATQKTTWADVGDYEYVCRVQWMPGSDRVCVRTTNRMQNEVDMYFVNRQTGAGRFIMKESNPAWVNVTDDLYFLKDGKHFIMASERSGYDHLYRFTMDGKLVNAVTSGEWALRASGGVYWLRSAVQRIDEKKGWVYFTAHKESALEKHLYRVKINGKKLQHLSKGRGTHAITMSPDGRYYFDQYSNISTPPALTLHRADGRVVSTLAESTYGGFEKYNAQYAKVFHIPARDGFPLPASITLPANFDSTRVYPVVVYVYGGPSAPQVSDSWQRNTAWENVLLNAGYICMKIDNRAASAVSKNLENLLLHNTPGNTELNDLVDAVQFMKKKSYIDNTRWGIYGWSGGGTNTILGMCRSKEFKAGIAGGSMIDYRFYDTIWGETMMKTEAVDSLAFERCSLLNHAKNLHGRLMLVHGSHDDNVHIQQIWRFVDKLIDADKLFELMVYPGRGHGVGDRAGRRHYHHSMLDFWERNLK